MKARLQKAGEIGFAGMEVRYCRRHGHVVWCACMMTPAQRRERERQKRDLLKAIKKLIRRAR